MMMIAPEAAIGKGIQTRVIRDSDFAAAAPLGHESLTNCSMES
jgi:hypothetical protein